MLQLAAAARKIFWILEATQTPCFLGYVEAVLGEQPLDPLLIRYAWWSVLSTMVFSVLPEHEENLVVAVPVVGKPRESSWGSSAAALDDIAVLSR